MGFEVAMGEKLETLEEIKSREVIIWGADMNLLDSTCNFKHDIFPDLNVSKLKAWFCVCGDQKIEGVDYLGT